MEQREAAVRPSWSGETQEVKAGGDAAADAANAKGGSHGDVNMKVSQAHFASHNDAHLMDTSTSGGMQQTSTGGSYGGRDLASEQRPSSLAHQAPQHHIQQQQQQQQQQQGAMAVVQAPVPRLLRRRNSTNSMRVNGTLSEPNMRDVLRGGSVMIASLVWVGEQQFPTFPHAQDHGALDERRYIQLPYAYDS
jgi:hypothetical protein